MIVLLQKGKGTGFAGAFGIGPGSETVFGPQSAQGMPVKITYVMAAMFMTIALLMSIISGRVGAGVAPDLVDETAMNDTPSSTSTGLEEYGLGTGITGQVDTSTLPSPDAPAPAPAVDGAPVVVETAPADVAPATPEAAPAEAAPATPEAAPAEAAPATPEAAAPAETPAPAAP